MNHLAEFYVEVCLDVAKQYNLVLVKGLGVGYTLQLGR